MYSDEQVIAFVKVYKHPRASLLIEEGVDLHQQFANELMIRRQEAKALYYEMSHSYDIRGFNEQ